MPSIIALPDWGLILTFSDIEVAINAVYPSYSSIYFNSEFPKSFVAIAICAEIACWDSLDGIQGILLKASSSASISRLKTDMTRYVYSVSKVTAKKLLKKYAKAKDLFYTESVYTSSEGSIRKSDELPPIAKRSVINLKLIQNDSLEEMPAKKNSENTESFEYSVSEDTEKYNKNFAQGTNITIVENPFVARLIENNTIRRDNVEMESPRFTSLESIENEKMLRSPLVLQTPLASPKQFGCPAHQIKFILKLQECKVSSTPKTSEAERYSLKTTITETYNRPEERTPCYTCDVCNLF